MFQGEMNSAADIQSQSMTELNATVDQLSVSVNEIAQNATQLAGVVADTKEDSDKVEDKCVPLWKYQKKEKPIWRALEMRFIISKFPYITSKKRLIKWVRFPGEIVDIIKLIGDIAEENNLSP